MSAAEFATLLLPAIIIGVGVGVAAWAAERLIDRIERRYATQAGARHAQGQHHCNCAADQAERALAMAELSTLLTAVERSRSGDKPPDAP